MVLTKGWANWETSGSLLDTVTSKVVFDTPIFPSALEQCGWGAVGSSVTRVSMLAHASSLTVQWQIALLAEPKEPKGWPWATSSWLRVRVQRWHRLVYFQQTRSETQYRRCWCLTPRSFAITQHHGWCAAVPREVATDQRLDDTLLSLDSLKMFWIFHSICKIY